MQDDAVTNLVVKGGESFVRTLTTAADAQDKLTDAIRNASSANPQQLGVGIQNLASALDQSNKQAALFTKSLEIALKQMGATPEVAAEVTRAIERQSKALLDNAKATEEAAEKNARLRANFKANLADVPVGTQTGLRATPTGFEAATQNFGRVTNLPESSQITAITNNLEHQRTVFLQNETNVRNSIEERAVQAAKLRADNRVRIEQQATERILAQEGQRAARTAQITALQAEKDRATRLQASEQTRRGANAQDIFTQSHPEFTAKTATTLKVPIVSTGVDQSTQAVRQQGEAFDSTSRKGITYLSNLSAIHAASFLLTGQTFTTLGSVTTLGLAFGKAAPAGSLMSGALMGVGASLGVLAAGAHFVVGSVEQVIQIVEAGAKSLLNLGIAGGIAAAAIVAASTKLASGVEDVMSEIAAFGGPTRQQFSLIEADISKVARTFGQSASSVGEGASLFIRAGGEIKDALEGGIAAVTRLTVASRGELIPAQSARSIVTITNAFKQFNVGADEAVNVLVGTAQKTALSFSEVTQAFQQAAPTAALLKIPLLDLAATIGVLANEGLRGQVAGTGFKQFLLDLLNPSDKAKAKLQELGISIQDQSGHIRPLRDIFADLKRALGDQADALDKTGDATKAQALAVIFGSRANLAAAIIARTGAEAFDELKTAIAGVSAAEVVDVLLSTTSAQAGILKTNIEELARAFGGPLNVAVGSIVKSINSFLGGSEEADARFERLRGGAQLAGQAIIAIFTGGGFSKISEALESIDNSQVKSFFSNILDSALTVRNAITSQLIPAFQQAGSSIGTALQSVEFKDIFGPITQGAVAFIGVASRVTGFVGGLITSFINGDETGNALRRTLTGLATAVGTSLVGAFVAAAVPIVIGVKLLGAVGGATLTLLDNMNKFNSIWEAGWQLAKDSVNNFLKDVAPRLQGLGDVMIGVATRNAEQIERGLNSIKVDQFNGAAAQVIKASGGIDQALVATSGRLQEIAEDIAHFREITPATTGLDQALGLNRAQEGGISGRSIQELERERSDLLSLFNTLQRIKQSGGTGLPTDNPIIAGILQAKKEIDTLRNEPPISLDSILNFGEGDLPDSLTAIAGKLKELQDVINAGAGERDPTEAGFFPDPKKAAQIEREILDITTNGAQEREDVIKDQGVRELEIRRATVGKLLDLATKFNRDREKIDEDRDKRIREADEDFAQRRSDRDQLQIISRGFEREAMLREQDQARRDQLIAQQDAAEDKQNQRRIQDQDTTLSKLEDRESHSQEIINQIRDRGFQRQQQNEATVFGRRQNLESTAFSRALQNQATARDNARRLAEAKPEDRAGIVKEIQQAGKDTTFQRQQEDQLTAFQNKQEDARTAFSRKQEDAAFQQQIKNEQSAFDFKVALELKYLKLRRDLEDAETIHQNEIERQRLERRLGFQRDDYGFRIEQADKLQAKQDEFADAEHERTNQRTRDEAEVRKTELGQRLSEDIFNLFEDQSNQLLNNQDQASKALRNIGQREERQLRQLGEREPTAVTATQIAIAQLNLGLLTSDALIRENTNDAIKFFDALRLAALEGSGVPTEAPRRVLPLTVPDLTTTQRASVDNAKASVDVSTSLRQVALAIGVLAQAQIQHPQQGGTVIFQNSNIGIPDLLDQIQNLFNRR